TAPGTAGGTGTVAGVVWLALPVAVSGGVVPPVLGRAPTLVGAGFITGMSVRGSSAMLKYAATTPVAFRPPEGEGGPAAGVSRPVPSLSSTLTEPGLLPMLGPALAMATPRPPARPVWAKSPKAIVVLLVPPVRNGLPATGVKTALPLLSNTLTSEA